MGWPICAACARSWCVIGQRVACALVAVLGHLHACIALLAFLGEIGRDPALPDARHTRNQRPVDLARGTGAEGLRHRGRGKARLGDYEAAGCILVEAMHETRLLPVVASQGIEHPVHMPLSARATLDREPHRLVDDENVLVLIKRDRLQEVAVALILGRAPRDRALLVELQGRHPDLLAGRKPLVGLRPLAVDPQLALADDALDVSESQLREACDQEAVDAHVGLVGLDHEGLHPGRQNLLGFRPGLSPCRPPRSFRDCRLCLWPCRSGLLTQSRGRTRLGRSRFHAARLRRSRLARRLVLARAKSLPRFFPPATGTVLS
ncbi:MAG: hypothetical protein K0S42_3610 [Microvirga sp.]|nr:hypothetical protein [Microvirga sp.]